MLTVNELFAGIGAFRKALIRLGIPHEIVGISEIDKYAIKSYNAIYGETRNYGDISKVERLDYADLWTYGFPCQDISLAGQLKGIVKGETRSGLLYEVQRLLAQASSNDTLPKYLIMENVKNLVGKKFRPDFEGWLKWLDELGYNNYWKVLNAVDYGIPQNRERVFCISIRKDIDTGYTFPSPIESDTVLMDKLEPVEDIDEKYFLSSECVKRRFTKNQINEEKGYGFKFSPVEREEAKIATTVTTIPTRDTANHITEKGVSSILEDNVDERYYLSDEMSSKLIEKPTDGIVRQVGYIKKTENGTQHQSNTVYDPKGAARTLTACDYKSPMMIKE